MDWFIDLVECGWYWTYADVSREHFKHEESHELLTGHYRVAADSGIGVVQIEDGNNFKWLDVADTRKFLYHQ